MRRGRQIRDDGSEPTFDSFLDIVANLVGILVILIMVIGVRAQDAWVHSGESAEAQFSEVPAKPDLASYRQRVDELDRELKLVHASQGQIAAQLDEEETKRSRSRQQLEAQQNRVNERRSAVAAQSEEASHEISAIADLQSYMRTLELQMEELKSSTPNTTVIQHYPTPIAKNGFWSRGAFSIARRPARIRTT